MNSNTLEQFKQGDITIEGHQVPHYQFPLGLDTIPPIEEGLKDMLNVALERQVSNAALPGETPDTTLVRVFDTHVRPGKMVPGLSIVNSGMGHQLTFLPILHANTLLVIVEHYTDSLDTDNLIREIRSGGAHILHNITPAQRDARYCDMQVDLYVVRDIPFYAVMGTVYAKYIKDMNFMISYAGKDRFQGAGAITEFMIPIESYQKGEGHSLSSIFANARIDRPLTSVDLVHLPMETVLSFSLIWTIRDNRRMPLTISLFIIDTTERSGILAYVDLDLPSNQANSDTVLWYLNQAAKHIKVFYTQYQAGLKLNGLKEIDLEQLMVFSDMEGFNDALRSMGYGDHVLSFNELGDNND